MEIWRSLWLLVCVLKPNGNYFKVPHPMENLHLLHQTKHRNVQEWPWKLKKGMETGNNLVHCCPTP
uniref:Uncharacterized protein n=1 Tax=Cucumis melo TaxID=3656 RepID=A0A9I9EHW9_CUCME